MDTSKSVDAVANATQEMIEAQRRSYEAITDAVVEGNKRGVRFVHSSVNSFNNSFDSLREGSRSSKQFSGFFYDPMGLQQQGVKLLNNWMSAGADYISEQAEHNQRLYSEFEKSARGQYENLHKVGEQWLSLYREAASSAGSYAEEGAQNARKAATQGLAAVQPAADKGVAANGSFPITGYEDLSVNDVFQRLRELSREDLEKVRSHETENKNRSSLVNELERRIKSAS